MTAPTLAERLERDAAGIDRGDHFDIDAHVALLREAAAIVRRWEGAEVVTIAPLAFHMLTLSNHDREPKRVRIVREEG